MSETMRIGRLFSAACCLLILLAGCPRTEETQSDSSGESPLAGVTLRLLVVDDPPLAKAVEKVRGEWKAQIGCELAVESVTEKELLAADGFEADAVLCPSYQLGSLAERGLIIPIPQKTLQEDERDRSEVFSLARRREVAWGSSIMAVPFGSPVLTCYYRADLLEKLGCRPPQTWVEYGELAKLLSDRTKLGQAAPPEDGPWFGAIEPLGPGWAGLVLLARAAPYAKHPDYYSTLFNIDSMEPLIDGPPMVRALRELVAVAKLGSAEQLITYNPASARAEFWQGRCGLALSWPTAAAKLPDGRGEDIACGLVELPGSTEVYNIGERAWKKRAEQDEPHVPLLATGGRIGVLGRRSAHPAAAARLLLWLSGNQLNPPPSSRSPATTLFRRSQMKSPQMWVEPGVSPAVARQYAGTTEKTFGRQQWLFALRIPGRAEYLAALDEAVHQAVRGEQSPANALRETAARWRKITNRLGLDRQLQAYRRSLELEP